MVFDLMKSIATRGNVLLALAAPVQIRIRPFVASSLWAGRFY